MRVLNQTCYETADLRRLFQRVATDELEPVHRKRVRVEVEHSRDGSVRGFAIIRGTRCTLRLPKPPRSLNPVVLAMVAAHEFAHLRGMVHRDGMNRSARYGWRGGAYREFYAWAIEYPIRIRQPKPKPGAMERIERKLATAHVGLKRAETRLKLYRTLFRRAEYRPGGSRRRAGGHFLSGREERSTTSGFSGASGLMVQKVAFWTGPSVTGLFPAVPPPAAQVLLVACCTQQSAHTIICLRVWPASPGARAPAAVAGGRFSPSLHRFAELVNSPARLSEPKPDVPNRSAGG